MSAVLIISPEAWDAHPVSKHHYARTLAGQGRQVLFLDPPHPEARAPTLKDVEDVPGLRILQGPRVAPGLRFMPAPLRRWLEARWLRRIEALSGTHISTIWLFENSRFFDMRFAGERLKIYHQVDLNQDQHPQVAARTADVCLCTTDIIRDRLRAVRPDVHKVHHGTIVADANGGDADLEKAFSQPGIHAVLVGNLDMAYLDVAGIAGLVFDHPQVHFHFIGGNAPANQLRERCAPARNARWWGKLPYTRIPALLAQADVLLVAYDARRFRNQLASPHKFMEYLLSGKVIVASYTDEYKDKRHLVEMAGPDEDIGPVFARVVQNLDTYNAPARMAERRAFALDHSYARQLDRIAAIVRETTGQEL